MFYVVVEYGGVWEAVDGNIYNLYTSDLALC